MDRKHFDETAWVDFARGVTGEKEKRAMTAHRTGCVRCQKTAGFLEVVLAACRADAECEVPAGAVRRVRAVFALRQPEKIRFLPRLSARLVFDSFLEPQPAGVRGAARLNRQVMYRGGNYFLDLWLEADPEAEGVALTGQIADERTPGKGPANIPVVLMAGDRTVVAHTTSDQFGEFRLRYTPQPRLNLYVPVNGKGSIRVAVGAVNGTRQKGIRGVAA